MSTLTDNAILAAMERGEITITPFNRENLGSNSYDVTLGNTIATYDFTYGGTLPESRYFDTRQPAPPLIYTEIPDDGMWLYPNILYLGVTVERTATPLHVPVMHGKSSLGRIGLESHV